MADNDRATLFGKLNTVAYKAMEAAARTCKMRGNPYLELAHWVEGLAKQDGGGTGSAPAQNDLHALIRAFDLDVSNLSRDITAALDKFPRGGSTAELSMTLEDAIERGWLYASLRHSRTKLRSGDVILGMLMTSHLRPQLFAVSEEFKKIKRDELEANYNKHLGDSDEASAAGSATMADGAVPGEASGAVAPAAMGKQEALQRFTVDLTEQAKTGEMDPVVGRDEEVRQIIDILMRRRQNNPILVGEAGVGKTAVVEGFALRIASGDVPPPLQGVRLLSLDIGLLQAGASMKGEFEQRLRDVIDEVQQSETPIILFIDEAHTLVGAGGQAGTGDAANLLKPALARGKLRTVAATTWAEYKKHIEKDPALTRRFQTVMIDQPDEHRGILMMRGIAGALEAHHRVQVLDEGIEASVILSHRYIPARQLPDKSVSLLDTACARVAVGQHATPAEVEDSRRRIEMLEIERKIVAKETGVGIDRADRAETIEKEVADEQERLGQLEQDWKAEKELVDQILDLRAKLRNPGALPDSGEAQETGENDHKQMSEDERKQTLDKLKDLQDKLHELQGERPLILPAVDASSVASVVADWTGIPVGRMVKDEIAGVLKLADRIEDRVIGQRHALDAIARRVRTNKAGLDNPGRPVGVFLLVGPSGVGKTETALSLAEALYGGEQNLVTINMSEFQEAHTVSTLKGSPPGYVGYGEGGILTEAVRRKPYSVVLLDEVEKAHPDVHELFFQVFDKGQMEDGEGRKIDFKNTLILLTSNVGSGLIENMCADPDLAPDVEDLAKAIRPELLKTFPAALLGRMVTVPYYPIADDALRAIIRLQLKKIADRLERGHGIPLEYGDDVVEQVAARCTETESGARAVDAILTHTLLPEVSGELLNRMLVGGRVERVKVGIGDDKAFTYDFE